MVEEALAAIMAEPRCWVYDRAMAPVCHNLREPDGRSRSSSYRVGLAGILLAIGVIACAPNVFADADRPDKVSTSSGTSGSSLSRYKDRTLSRISPYAEQRRWEAYLAVSDLFDRLWRHPTTEKTLKQGSFGTFEKFPLLHLEDRDGDGKAEFFSYTPPDGSGRTQEFGAMFDLNGDGRPDWIVYYGGILLTKDMKVAIWTQQAIDTNGDGRFDIRVYGAIDMDKDGFVDEEASTWLYDTNHDGLVDKAEHIVKGRITPIEPVNGVLPRDYLLDTDPAKQPKIGDAMPVRLFEAITHDINMLAGN